jgi:hypothetical protein
MTRSSPFGCAFAALSALAMGCLDRPVSSASPTVTARVSQPATQTRIDKIDLLFMIDNSSSMADKQKLLADVVPDLVSRLVNPVCVSSTTYEQKGPAPGPGASCPAGQELDFQPVKSIHIGIVTSSLGSHGAAGICDDRGSRSDPHDNDKAELVTRGASSPPADGFLAWAAETSDEEPNALDAKTVQQTFKEMVGKIGQHGCGYEAQLEAPYRFLVDPDPPSAVEITTDAAGIAVAHPTYPDTTILDERAKFLRPDSLVAVILVTDETDDSLSDDGQAYLSILPPTGSPPHGFLMHGTTVCKTDPNSPCCFNCGQAPPAGCPDPRGDPECQAGVYGYAEDPPNDRQILQKQRWGVDFRYPVQRYIDGFTKRSITNRAGQTVTNPLFDDLGCSALDQAAHKCTRMPSRDPSLVFVAGIVGVPWQDIAVDPTDLKSGYKPAKELARTGTWDVILGDPSASPFVHPKDPLMIEQVAPRTQTTTANPLGTAALPSPPDSVYNANPVNGHDWDTSAIKYQDDLQYACIFDLPPDYARDCADPANTADCDCTSNSSQDPTHYENPLCQDAATGAYSTKQTRAKAYPGVRELQVLRGLGDQAIVASICPANTLDQSQDTYGYRPAIRALIDRLRNALRGQCLPRALGTNADGTVPCIVYEAYNPQAGASCDCGEKTPGRSYADRVGLPDEMANLACVCQIDQLTAQADVTRCQTDPDDGGAVGWCYVDPMQMTDASMIASACGIVRSCPATDRRLIRFAGPNHAGEPRAGAIALVMCQEASTLESKASGDVCAAQAIP